MKICMKCLLIIVSLITLAGCGTTSTYYITSNPTGASVRIDRRVIGATPIEVEYDDPVNKELVLTKAGYKTVDFPLKTLRSPRERVHFDLDLKTIGVRPTLFTFCAVN